MTSAAKIPIYGRAGVVAYALVDANDAQTVSARRWSMGTDGDAKCAASRATGWAMVRMHRLITKAPPGMDVDHINHDKLDNRRCNLRVCTRAQNSRNRSPNAGRKLPKGVHVNGKSIWKAAIKYLGKSIHLGNYRSIDAAAQAYVSAAATLFGEFAPITTRRANDHQPH